MNNKAIRSWFNRLGVKTLYVESFNGRLRDELLNREIFATLEEARVLIEQWRKDYNQICPHSAKNYRPPAPETILTTVTTQELVQLMEAGQLGVVFNKEAAKRYLTEEDATFFD